MNAKRASEMGNLLQCLSMENKQLGSPFNNHKDNKNIAIIFNSTNNDESK